jgi:hypothetical protein
VPCAFKELHRTLAILPLRRLPSARETLHVLLACLVPIVAWSVFPMLHDGLPGWSRQMSAWDVVGVVAYVQAFALTESIAVCLLLLLLSALLPLSWFRDKFVPLATGIVYLSAAWFALGQFHDDKLRTWNFRQLLPWAAAYLASLLLLSTLIHRSPRIEALIDSFVERISVLASAYLLIGVAAVVIVLIRNL